MPSLHDDIVAHRQDLPLELIDDVVGIIVMFGKEVTGGFLGSMMLTWQRADPPNKQILHKPMSTLIRKYKLLEAYVRLQEEHPMAAHYSKEYLLKHMKRPDPGGFNFRVGVRQSAKSSPNPPSFSTFRRMLGEWKE